MKHVIKTILKNILTVLLLASALNNLVAMTQEPGQDQKLVTTKRKKAVRRTTGIGPMSLSVPVAATIVQDSRPGTQQPATQVVKTETVESKTPRDTSRQTQTIVDNPLEKFYDACKKSDLNALTECFTIMSIPQNVAIEWSNNDILSIEIIQFLRCIIRVFYNKNSLKSFKENFEKTEIASQASINQKFMLRRFVSYVFEIAALCHRELLVEHLLNKYHLYIVDQHLQEVSNKVIKKIETNSKFNAQYNHINDLIELEISERAIEAATQDPSKYVAESWIRKHVSNESPIVMLTPSDTVYDVPADSPDTEKVDEKTAEKTATPTHDQSWSTADEALLQLLTGEDTTDGQPLFPNLTITV